MREGGKLYGAVVSGEHRFFHNAKGKPEVLQGRARFTRMLLLKDLVWKVSRVLSYDRGPAQVATKLTKVQLAAGPSPCDFDGRPEGLILVAKPAAHHLSSAP